MSRSGSEWIENERIKQYLVQNSSLTYLEVD